MAKQRFTPADIPADLAALKAEDLRAMVTRLGSAAKANIGRSSPRRGPVEEVVNVALAVAHGSPIGAESRTGKRAVVGPAHDCAMAHLQKLGYLRTGEQRFAPKRVFVFTISWLLKHRQSIALGASAGFPMGFPHGPQRAVRVRPLLKTKAGPRRNRPDLFQAAVS